MRLSGRWRRGTFGFFFLGGGLFLLLRGFLRRLVFGRRSFLFVSAAGSSPPPLSPSSPFTEKRIAGTPRAETLGVDGLAAQEMIKRVERFGTAGAKVPEARD